MPPLLIAIIRAEFLQGFLGPTASKSLGVALQMMIPHFLCRLLWLLYLEKFPLVILRDWSWDPLLQQFPLLTHWKPLLNASCVSGIILRTSSLLFHLILTLFPEVRSIIISSIFTGSQSRRVEVSRVKIWTQLSYRKHVLSHYVIPYEFVFLFLTSAKTKEFFLRGEGKLHFQRRIYLSLHHKMSGHGWHSLPCTKSLSLSCL